MLAYWLAGGYLGLLIEGYDRVALSMVPLYVTLVALCASLAMTIRWARKLGRGAGAEPRGAEAGPASGSSVASSQRRRFLLGGLAAVAGVVSTTMAAVIRNRDWYTVSVRNIFAVRPPYKADVALSEWSGSRVVEYRRLGRTEARVSDISLGSGAGTGGRQTIEVVREAIERGINYFDTAPDYSGADSENRFGQAIVGLRDQIFLATKFCRPTGHLAPGSSVEEYMAAVDGSLSRLHTDRVDLVHIHSCDSLDRLMDENAHEAFDRLKEQGKVRFLGVSTHTPHLEQVANAAIDSDRFDVMMLAYHHGAWPRLAEIIDRAAAADVGIVAMKTLRGSHHRGLLWSRDERDSFTQASFKWVLSNPSVSCLVISLWESAQLDEFLFASGGRPNAADHALLERYRELTAGIQCRPHCGQCLDRCPEGLAIHEVLRHRMYYEGYGAQKEAIQGYGRLEKKADVCVGCSAPCASACPDGIAIPERVRETHALLSLS